MKAGTTQTLILDLEVNIAHVENIIFTLQGVDRLSLTYPENVIYKDGKFELSLSQEDTLKLAGTSGSRVYVEAQINFKNKAVAKSIQSSIVINSTLATKVVEDNKSDGNETIELNLLIDGEVIYAGGGGSSSDYNSLYNKPKINGTVLKGDVSLEEIGVDDHISEYVEEHKQELKGDTGEAGPEGKPGKDMVHQGELVTESGEVRKTLTANMLCLFSMPVSALVIELPEKRNFYDEFNFIFITDSTGCELTLPDNIVWQAEPQIKGGMYYECSILNDVAIISAGLAVK